jgi:hypothetical protein
MDQVTTTLIQAAVANDVYDASLQSLRYRLTATSHNEICYSASLDTWVTACNNGTIGVSRNGMEWYYFYLQTTNNLNSVAFANGLFVAVGSNSTVFTSTNGYDWIQRTFPVASLTLTEVVYNNSLWVVSCNTGSQQIFTSTDAITWTLKWNTTAGFQSTLRYYPLTYYATSIWMTIIGGQVATSTDGTTWTLRPISTNVIFSHVHYTGSVWIAAGALVANTNSIVLAYSTDGVAWSAPNTISTTTRTLILTSNANNVLIGTAANNIWASLDNGLTGTFVSTGQAGGTTSLTYGNSRWVLTSGGSGDVMVSTTGGVTWTKTVASGFGVTSVMIYANNLFVAGIGGSIKTSPDATTWTTQITTGSGGILDIKFFDGKFVAVGSSGSIRTSATGTGTWSSPTSPTAGSISRVSFGNGLWVGVGVGIIVTSSDAVTWSLISLASNYNHVEYNNGAWVAYGSSNSIIRSTTGTSWTFVNRDLQQPRSIEFGNGAWTAVGAGGEITTSLDLNNWTFRTSGTANQLNRIVYRNNTWVAVGASGTIVTSTDAINWTTRNSNTSVAFNDVEYNSVNNFWVGVGSSGLYRQTTGTNLATWTGSSTLPNNFITAIAAGSATRNKFIAVSSSGGIYNCQFVASSLNFQLINNGINSLSSNPINNGLYSVAAGRLGTDTTYTYVFACGVGGIIRYGYTLTNTSNLPNTWTAIASGTTNTLQKIVAGNNIFVAVGVNGTIVSSNLANLPTLTARTSGTTQTLNDVAYGLVNGTTPTWVAVGNNGTILRSTDGTTWAAASNTGGLSTNKANCVTFANNRFVVGNSGNIATLRYSSDGNTWTAATGTTTNFEVFDVVYGAGIFMATTSGFAYTSTDGIAWTAAATGTNLYKTVVDNGARFITFLNNKFIAFPWFTTSVIYVSKNGTDWYQIAVPFSSSRDSIEYYDGKYVIVAGAPASTGYVGYSTI